MLLLGSLVLAACLALGVSTGLPPADLPNYVRLGECRTSADCGPSRCCVIGMVRYSLPTCQPMRRLGESCRPASERPFSTTLSYPGGLRLSLRDAYQVMCPCDAAQGLACSRLDGTCVAQDGHLLPDDNSI